MNKPHHRDLFWTESAQVTAARHGIEVTIPADLHQPIGKEKWRSLFDSADGVISVWGTPLMDSTVLGPCPSIRFLGHAGGSVAGIVTPFLYQRGIQVSTANSIMAESVARWCLMMTLVGMKRLMEFAQWGQFAPLRWDKRCPAMAPSETVIGLWGYGDISRLLLDFLKPLKPREILVCSRSMTRQKAHSLGVTLVDLETLFSRSHVIHLLQALNDRTKGIVGTDLLHRIQDGAVLINAGRAHLLNEQDFLQSLRQNRYLAISDVHFEEPLSANSPFRSLDNVIFTPHVGALEGEFNYVTEMIEEYARFLKGEPLRYGIGKERALGMTVEMTRKPVEKS